MNRSNIRAMPWAKRTLLPIRITHHKRPVPLLPSMLVQRISTSVLQNPQLILVCPAARCAVDDPREVGQVQELRSFIDSMAIRMLPLKGRL